MTSIIPIPLPFDKPSARELPPHLDPFRTYNLSPGASSSSTPAPRHSPSVVSRSTPQPPVEHEDDQGEDEENIFRDMSWDEILEDLNARFLINLPKEEMSMIRVYWQAEQAHWFYEDYLRPLNPVLPSLSQRNFTRIIIESSPLYTSLLAQGGINYDEAWAEYCSYKRMVPCCGGILINAQGDKCLMVRGFKSNAGWSFPRGKINLEESQEACAIREVEEETGFDLTGMINPPDKIQTHINAQEVTMFIVKGIDESTVFETQTRNEIGAIEWVRLMDLPTWHNKRGPKRTGGNGQKKFYNVTPFVNPLKQWLKSHGIDPYQKPKKKPQANNTLRDLQPYQFDSPVSVPGSPAPSKGSSALDHLFSRFIHKQEEELDAPNAQTAIGSDNAAGLERLFGGLNVLKEEEDSLTRQPLSGLSDEDRKKNEDDALAILLGGLGGQTPAAESPKPVPATQKGSDLLAMLNQREPFAAEQPKPRANQRGVQAQPQPKPHQAKLLAMFAETSQQGTEPGQAVVPKPADVKCNSEDSQRQAKARALLDMTLAGMETVSPVTSVQSQNTHLHQNQPGQLPTPPHAAAPGLGDNPGASPGLRAFPPFAPSAAVQHGPGPNGFQTVHLIGGPQLGPSGPSGGFIPQPNPGMYYNPGAMRSPGHQPQLHFQQQQARYLPGGAGFGIGSSNGPGMHGQQLPSQGPPGGYAPPHLPPQPVHPGYPQHSHQTFAPPPMPPPNPAITQYAAKVSPVKQIGTNHAHVHHPAPRQPVGQGANLLAMINGADRGRDR